MAKQIAAFLLISYSVFAGVYGGGSGTVGDPYQIWTVEHLDELGATLDDYDKAFIMVADIDLAGIVYSQAPIAADQDPNTWGLQGTLFSGVFDGNSHTIRNLTVQNKGVDYIGLFGKLDNGAEVKQLSLENVSLVGRNVVGALAAASAGDITNCHVSGYISGNYAVGGISAFLEGGSILYCTTNITLIPHPHGVVNNPDQLGGLVGVTQFGTISDSWSVFVLSTKETIRGTGGLVGLNRSATIEHCWAQAAIDCNNASCVGGLCGYNSGSLRNCLTVDLKIQTKGSDIGGLVGKNASLISQCISEGTVSGQSRCGGLIGDNKGYVIDSYTSVTINSETFSGGFVASNHYGILRCYSLGAAQCRSFEPGGFVGQNLGYINHSFWDIETSGIFQSDGAEGMNSQQLKQIATYRCWGDGVWVIEENVGYPKLIWENTPGVVIRDEPAVYSGGSGTEDDPFLIDTVEQLSGISEYPQDLSKCYKLMNDLDMSGVDFSGVGFGYGFGGTFDGNGYTVSNLKLDGNPGYTGFFCVILKNGTVRNLNLINYEIQGAGYVGGLAGKNEGTLTNCTTQGRLTVLHEEENTSSGFGGLTGFNYGDVNACWADIELVVSNYKRSMGGLVGMNLGVIRQSCSTGSIIVTGKGAYQFGGLVGYCGYDSKIFDCYSTVDLTVGGERCFSFGGLTGRQYYQTLIERSYYSGTIVIEPNSRCKDYGGIVGLNSHKTHGDTQVIDCFWNIETSGLSEGIGQNFSHNADPVGLSFEQMLDINTYAQADWSVDSVPNEGAVWIVLPDSLPELSCFIAQEPQN